MVNLPNGKRAIGTKWVFRNKKDERGIIVRNKARLVAQGYTQEEGFDYDEVFAPVARIEAIMLFLAYASFMAFIVYQMDVNSAFLYSTIEEEVYVCQPLGFEDSQFPEKVYKIPDKFYGELTFFLGLQVQQKKDGIFISQDKYVAGILKKFDFATVKTASTTMEPNKALIKDEEADSVDVPLYRSMIGSLMYLTAYRPDITFVVYACAMFQVTPKTSHLHAVKRIFRYLKGKPKLGLWYPRDSPFDLEAFSDSDYARASLDMKSTTGGCQFLGKRLILWQCKKQTIVVNSTIKAEYVAAANCRGQVLWVQNQMLDYGFNFMNTKIYIDNESTICIVKNPVFHSKTKHIEIRHHFIRDSYEKKLIQVIKIHTDHNVADLLTKAFDVSSGPIHLVADETVIKEWEDRMERAATTASSLEAEQDSGNINRTQSMATLNESFPQGTDSGSGPRCQDTILGGAEAQIRFEAASKQSNDPPLSRVNTLGSGEDNMKLKELMEFCTKLSVRAFDLLNLLLPVLVYAARHSLTAVRHKLMLSGITYYCWFWATAKTKTVNGECQIQALADKKKVAITEKSVRSDLMLDDTEGTECLPNDHLEGGVKFLMYPRFVQVFLDKQVEGMIRHKEVYVTPSHTKKVFANMKRSGKGFSRRVTPLFPTMMIQASEDMGEDSAAPSDSHSTPIIS
ncbi:putative reverse transcriptase, RNA-dependent DNA polymerase [Tanacetum coccineum]